MKLFHPAALLAALIVIVAAALLPGITLAHQPHCEFADLTAAEPWQVPDAAISYAYFGNTYPAGDVDYFAFEAQRGQRVLLSLSIPVIPDQEPFAPLIAVYGPGLTGETPAALPASVRIPAGQSAIIIPLGDEPAHWFEPFGRRYFWNWDNDFLTAPQDATYTAILWHPQQEIGRYAFVIGQREVFGGDADCYQSYGEYWTPLTPGINPYRDTPSHMLHSNASQAISVDPAAAPTLDLQLFPLADGSVNLRLHTRNFTFAPQQVDTPAVPGEGYANLYIDGAKIARLYSEWFHIADLPAGAQELTVALYASNHQPFALNGSEIAASIPLPD